MKRSTEMALLGKIGHYVDSLRARRELVWCRYRFPSVRGIAVDLNEEDQSANQLGWQAINAVLDRDVTQDQSPQGRKYSGGSKDGYHSSGADMR